MYLKQKMPAQIYKLSGKSQWSMSLVFKIIYLGNATGKNNNYTKLTE